MYFYRALWRTTQVFFSLALFTSCGTEMTQSIGSADSTVNKRSSEKYNFVFSNEPDPCSIQDCPSETAFPSSTPSATPSGTVAPSPTSQPTASPSMEPSPSPSPAMPDEPNDEPTGDDPELEPRLDDHEAKECSAILGVEAKKIHIAKGGPVSINADQALAIKVTGNQQEVSVTVNSTSKEALPGICVFMAGNQSKIRIDAKSSVKMIYYVGRGNQSSGAIAVAKAATVSKIRANLSGNQATLKVSGEGAFTCESEKMRGNDPNFICK